MEKSEKSKEPEVKYFVRIANTDLDGKKGIGHSLTRIKGISFMFSNMVCHLANVDKSKLTGILTDDEVKKIDDTIKDPVKAGAPLWILNRRFDPQEGTNSHLISSNLTFIQDNDVKLMKKIKTYRGLRHSLGLPVRGQKTRSNFRRNKGKVMGVIKKDSAKPGKT